MSDEEIQIRHVCECGLAENHDSVCRPTRLAVARRVDTEWEEANARQREARHSKRQPGFRGERQSGRRALSNRELASLAEVRLAKLSPVPAGNISPSHGAGGHPSVNLAERARSVDPRADPRWKASDDSERNALLRKHDLLDEYEGLGVAAPERELTPEQKDAEIVHPDHEGLTAAQFARQYPGYGSPKTIANKRRWFAAGLCTMSGQTPREACHCPTCRRALA